jgi:hypothetical protein
MENELSHLNRPRSFDLGALTVANAQHAEPHGEPDLWEHMTPDMKAELKADDANAYLHRFGPGRVHRRNEWHVHVDLIAACLPRLNIPPPDPAFLPGVSSCARSFAPLAALRPF